MRWPPPPQVRWRRALTSAGRDRDIDRRLQADSPPGPMVCDVAHGCPGATSPGAMHGRRGRRPASLRPSPPRGHGALPDRRAPRRRVLRRHDRAGGEPTGMPHSGAMSSMPTSSVASSKAASYGSKCEACRYEHLVPFSCRKRGFCPSCGVHRMVETAAHLVDPVLPRIPMRQWVVTFPWPLAAACGVRRTSLGRLADSGPWGS